MHKSKKIFKITLMLVVSVLTGLIPAVGLATLAGLVYRYGTISQTATRDKQRCLSRHEAGGNKQNGSHVNNGLRSAFYAVIKPLYCTWDAKGIPEFPRYI